MRIDFLNKTINTKAEFNKIATTNPRITMLPSMAGNGITAFGFPPLRIPNSTNLNMAEIMKQQLQINTILVKKRNEESYRLKM